MRYVLAGSVLLMGVVSAFADLGIMDTVSEATAKNGASGLGITQVYDHPADSPNGQFVVPVQYNRTNAEGNGAEHDANDAKANDIDYIPLAQLKGANGVAGATGSTGSKGDVGAKGKDGHNGRDGTDATIDNHLFLNVGVGVRWYDWKYIALTSGYRYDVRHYNHTVDAVVVQIKLGRSYEQRELDKLRKEVESLSLQHMALLDR